MVILDAPLDVVTLISSNWNSTNTDNITPTIDKITNVPFDMQFGDNKGFILIYSISESEQIPGLGLVNNADIEESIKIDIRYGGMGDLDVTTIESRFNKYKAELRRILYSNRVNPSINYDVLDLDNTSIQNLSNKSKKLFREVREVKMTRNNIDLTV